VKAPAWIKLLLLASLSVLIVWLPLQWPMALAVMAFIVAVDASPSRLFKMLLPAVPFIIALSALQALLQGSGAAVAGFWGVYLTWGGLMLAAVSASRMTLLYLAGSAFTATTGEAELASIIGRALRPLDRLTGLSIGRDLSTMTALALAFIPIVHEEYASIKLAQEARGVRYHGPINAMRGIIAVAVPLLHSLSRRADDVALAMEARCYGLKK
jgi:energy-coupling factor transport system permease protein